MPKLVLGFLVKEEIVTVKSISPDLTSAQKMLENIYDQHDRRYFHSIEKMLLKFFTTIGTFTKTKRHTKANFGQEGKCLVNIFVWWVALCSFYKFDAADILWKKFPGVCPYCLVAKDCNCEQQLRKISGKSLPALRLSGVRPKTIAGWQNMFRMIYGKANDQATFEYAVFRLFEEIEEVISSIFPEVTKVDALQLELADLGARIFGLANKLGIDLQNQFLFYYRGVCPECLNEKCSCDSLW